MVHHYWGSNQLSDWRPYVKWIMLRYNLLVLWIRYLNIFWKIQYKVDELHNLSQMLSALKRNNIHDNSLMLIVWSIINAQVLFIIRSTVITIIAIITEAYISRWGVCFEAGRCSGFSYTCEVVCHRQDEYSNVQLLAELMLCANWNGKLRLVYCMVGWHGVGRL